MGTGIPALDAALVWGGAFTALAAAVALLWRVLRGTLRLTRAIGRVVDDWHGEEARPGVPGRPGLMERVGGIEDRLTAVEHELYPNSGASLRDAVDLANRRLAQLCDDDPGSAPPGPASAPPAP
ncbi:hypothetical protein [Kitasatospora aureofaciens]|uniref:hypothetical protein n=1 Tax=Kitasatospora aureofaciens TaxID=1894 RepID=UPI0033D539AB